ncbi:MAG: hypothetical protein ACTSYI_08865, partial [Promethearchaeota archaeon]
DHKLLIKLRRTTVELKPISKKDHFTVPEMGEVNVQFLRDEKQNIPSFSLSTGRAKGVLAHKRNLR